MITLILVHLGIKQERFYKYLEYYVRGRYNPYRNRRQIPSQFQNLHTECFQNRIVNIQVIIIKCTQQR